MEVPKSRFLDFYRDYGATLDEASELVGDIILVEKVQFPEPKVGSLYLGQASTHVNNLVKDIPTFYRVLYVGCGWIDDETFEDVDVDCEPGDIVLLPETSVKTWARFPLLEIPESNLIGISNYSNVQWRFKNEEAFFEFLTKFNQSTTRKV